MMFFLDIIWLLCVVYQLKVWVKWIPGKQSPGDPFSRPTTHAKEARALLHGGQPCVTTSRWPGAATMRRPGPVCVATSAVKAKRLGPAYVATSAVRGQGEKSAICVEATPVCP